MLTTTNIHFHFLSLLLLKQFSADNYRLKRPPHFTRSSAKLVSTSSRNAAGGYKAEKKRRSQRKAQLVNQVAAGLRSLLSLQTEITSVFFNPLKSKLHLLPNPVSKYSIQILLCSTRSLRSYDQRARNSSIQQ